MADKLERKAEAEKRLSKLGLHPNVLKDFKRGVLNYSERSPLGGILYWVDNNPEWKDLIDKKEEELGATFYHFTHEYTEFGECLSGLFVSQYDDEWDFDEEDMDNNEAFAYVINLDAPEFSEFGKIGFKEIGGGLVRTY